VNILVGNNVVNIAMASISISPARTLATAA
jgi:hypothetical protein